MEAEKKVTVRFIDWNSVDGFSARTIRFNVFVDEQKVPAELELDETDLVAVHVLAVLEDGIPCGTGRLFPDESDPTVAHIGRMAVLKEYRGVGCGSAILHSLVAYARENGYAKARLSAQCHALAFYERHGFEAYGDIYDDAGISHRAMQLMLNS